MNVNGKLKEKYHRCDHIIIFFFSVFFFVFVGHEPDNFNSIADL